MENTTEKLKQIFNIEKGMYTEAINSGKTFGMWLEDYRVDKGMEPTIYQDLTNSEVHALKKKIKAAGEKVPLTTFEEILKAYDIRTYGPQTDRVEKFFATSDTSVLFPEYLATQVYAGIIQGGLVDQFIATTTNISGEDFRKVYLQDVETERQLSIRGASGEFPRSQIKVGRQTVNLGYYGRAVEFSYATMSQTPLNVVSKMMQRIGMQIDVDETDDMIYTLLNGDGNSNGLEADQTKNPATTATITKTDVITFTNALPSGYQLDKFVGRDTYIQKFWDALSDMTNPMAQWGVTGLTLPIGYKWERSVLTADYLLGVDSRYAVGKITNDALSLTESDKIIDKHQVLTVISKRTAFDIIDQDAIGCLDCAF